MSDYSPPTFDSPNFNTSLFLTDGGGYLTLLDADSRYLRLAGGTITGALTCTTGAIFNGGLTSTGLTVSGNTSYTAANGSITLSGTNANILISGTNGKLNLSGVNSLISLSNTAASTTSTTGAIQCAGGAYFGANSIFNANLNVVGTLTAGSFTLSTLSLTTLSVSTSITMGSVVINSTELGFLDGAVAGIGTANKALVLSASRSVNNLNFITLDTMLVQSMVQWQGTASWNFRQPFSTYMQIDTGTNSLTTGLYLRLLTGNNASYVDWTFQNTDYFNLTNMGFYRVGTNTATTAREWIRNDGGALGFSTRTPFTGSSGNADIFIHNNIGVVSIGRSALINSAHRLEVNGALMISDTATTVNLTNTPSIGIYNSAQATGLGTFISYGKNNSTSIADYQFSGYYSGSTSSANNYTLWQSNGSNGGLTMNGFSNVKITARNGGAYSAPTGAAFEVVGHETSITVPSGWSYTPTGSASIGGGAVSICAKFSNNVWATGIFYSTSDKRLKQDITNIPEDDFKKILNLEPVSYKWINDPTSLQHGFVAQQVAEYLPELVNIAENKEEPLIDDDIQLILSYNEFIPYLIGLCKVQQNEIEELKKDIKDLKEKNKYQLSYPDLYSHIHKTVLDILKNDTQQDQKKKY